MIRNMNDRANYDTRIISVLEALESGRECHHLSCTERPYVATRGCNPEKDKVRGTCNHCKAVVERPLNAMEIRHAYQFLASLDDSRVH